MCVWQGGKKQQAASDIALCMTHTLIVWPHAGSYREEATRRHSFTCIEQHVSLLMILYLRQESALLRRLVWVWVKNSLNLKFWFRSVRLWLGLFIRANNNQVIILAMRWCGKASLTYGKLSAESAAALIFLENCTSSYSSLLSCTARKCIVQWWLIGYVLFRCL